MTRKRDTGHAKGDTGYAKGVWAEARCAVWLRLKGYKILEKRWKTPQGEIDLIVKRGNTVAFVEVKYRPTVEEAAEAIHARAQGRIRTAAELYLQRYPAYNDCDLRFDALILTNSGLFRHIENAWGI